MQSEPTEELLNLTFYATPGHRCSYLPNQTATTAFLDPDKKITQKLYSRLSENGFRRSGDHIYRPHCQNCNACVPVRIPVSTFVPTKNQMRCSKKAQHLTFLFEPAEFSDNHYQLYENYINTRHHDGDMYPTSQKQFKEFLICSWANTQFLSFYDNKKLIACSVVDLLDNGYSAVYNYFDPAYSHLGLGKLAILTLIEQSKLRDLPYVYLGYLIKDCRKMKYKSEYRPLDCLIGNRWVTLT